jgi:hypothetical protein
MIVLQAMMGVQALDARAADRLPRGALLGDMRAGRAPRPQQRLRELRPGSRSSARWSAWTSCATRSPELGHGQRRPRGRARHRRHPDRDGRHRDLLPAQRGQLRRRRRSLLRWTAAAAAESARACAPRASCARACATRRRTPTSRAAGDDGAGRLLAYEFQVSLPVLAQRTFHGGSEAYGFMTAAMGVGAVIGGLVHRGAGPHRAYARWSSPRPASAADPGLRVRSEPRRGRVRGDAVRRLGERVVHIHRQLHDPARRPPGMRGRVIALWQVAFQGTTPVGGPLVGWIIAVSDPRTGLAVGAVACLVAAAGALLYVRPPRARVREATRVDLAADGAAATDSAAAATPLPTLAADRQ